MNNPVQVYFGKGCRTALKEIIQNKACLVITSENGRKRVCDDHVLSNIFSLTKSISWIDDIKSNPDLDDLDSKSQIINNIKFDTIIAIGGGSVIDSAKFFVALKKSNNFKLKVKDFLLDKTNFCKNKDVNFIAIPTTFGTGSEVTSFATVWDHKNNKKHSLSHIDLYSNYAIVDSELSYSLPLNVTVSTGLDAICQAFESIWNRSMNSSTEQLAHRSISDGISALNILLQNLHDESARDVISNSSLLAGLCISHTKTALCHSISYPLTSMYGIDHGIACAFTMVEVLKYNLESKDVRFDRLFKAIEGSNCLSSLIENIEELLIRCDVYKIVKKKAINLDNIIALSQQMIVPGRSDNCLFNVNTEVIEDILVKSWKN